MKLSEINTAYQSHYLSNEQKKELKKFKDSIWESEKEKHTKLLEENGYQTTVGYNYVALKAITSRLINVIYGEDGQYTKEGAHALIDELKDKLDYIKSQIEE